MAKRRVTAQQLRDMVRARRTKGMAFMLKGDEYTAEQERVKAELAAMTPTEIFAAYPQFTYDLE